jgi:hypothetical protein
MNTVQIILSETLENKNVTKEKGTSILMGDSSNFKIYHHVVCDVRTCILHLYHDHTTWQDFTHQLTHT